MNLKRVGKKYKIIDHLSDIGIEFCGNTLEELFESAAEGMFSIMCDLRLVKPLERRNVRITKGNINCEDLLILWLERLLYWYEVENILFSEFRVDRIDKRNHNLVLNADISGEKIDLDKHEIRVSIKAPTYHMLEVKSGNRGYNWRGRVIFDI
jgi:SHS2 domain-containing protein